MNLCRWAAGGALALMLVTSGSYRFATADTAAASKPNAVEQADAGKEAVFNLKEVPIVEQQNVSGLLSRTMFRRLGSLTAKCQPAAEKTVKAYPKLNSKRPLYGALILLRDPAKPESAKTFHFVLDQSEVASGGRCKARGRGRPENGGQVGETGRELCGDAPGDSAPAAFLRPTDFRRRRRRGSDQ